MRIPQFTLGAVWNHKNKFHEDKAIADKAIADKLRKFPLLDLFAVDWAFHDVDQQKIDFLKK